MKRMGRINKYVGIEKLFLFRKLQDSASMLRQGKIHANNFKKNTSVTDPKKNKRSLSDGVTKTRPF